MKGILKKARTVASLQHGMKPPTSQVCASGPLQLLSPAQDASVRVHLGRGSAVGLGDEAAKGEAS